MIFFVLEIYFTLGYITEIIACRSGDLQIENFMQPLARLLACAMWPPQAHEFDTPGVIDKALDLLLKNHKLNTENGIWHLTSLSGTDIAVSHVCTTYSPQ